jgi:glycosyltransferase involved in cell wall biosynthesis
MISVIIPTRDQEVALAMSLAALVPAATEGIVREVIVVDGGSRDGTLAVADAAGCNLVEVDGDRPGGLRRAAEIARGDWLLFLAPTVVLDTGWQDEALNFIDGAVLAGEGRLRAACFTLGRLDGGLAARLGLWGAALRARLFATPRDEQGLLLSKSLYRSLGGHRAGRMTGDGDLARRVGARRLTILRSRAVWRGDGRRLAAPRRLVDAAGLEQVPTR